jgi:DNA topoisomerase-1
VNSIEIPGADGIVLRVGRYGPYLQRGDDRASVPEDLAPDELTREKAEELLAKPSGDRELGPDPESGLQIVARDGRYGPYVSEILEEGSTEKPRTASLFKTMSLDTITLEDALRLLSLPRALTAPDGEEILISNGRYGPFIKKGKETRSLPDEEQLFTATVEEAMALLAEPKQRRGRGQAKPPLKDLGADPASGKPIVVKDGRFGPYVTDGETNASLRRGDDPEGLTMDRALELLAERRAKGPAPKKTRRPAGRR